MRHPIGIYVSTIKVEKSARLRTGDVIVLGDTKLEVDIGR